MIVFIREYYDQGEEHFNARYEQRVSSLDLNHEQYNILDANFKAVEKVRHLFKKSGLGFRLLKFSENNEVIYDKRGVEFRGNELWVVIKGGKFVTVIIRSNDEMSDKKRARKAMGVEYVAYGTRDLENALKDIIKKSRKP